MTLSVERREENVSYSQRLLEIFEQNVVHSARNRQRSSWNVPNLPIMKIKDGGRRHIEFQKMPISTLRATTARWLPAYIESISDDYNL